MKCVYFFRPVGQIGPIKIGCSTTPEHRLEQYAAWSPLMLELIATAPGSHADEHALHGKFRKYHLHGEWFGASKDLLALIDHVQATGELPELPRVVRLPMRRTLTAKPSLRVSEQGQAELFRAEYEAGGTLTTIADAHGVALSKVRRLLAAAGTDIRSRGRPAQPVPGNHERSVAMARLYRGGKTLEEIGVEYGVTRERVRQILRKIGVESLGLRKEHVRQPDPLTEAQLQAVELYQADVRPREIEARLGVTIPQIHAALKRLGIKRKSQGAWLVRPDDEQITAEVARLYRSGLSAREIAARVDGVNFPETIYRYLSKAGVATRRPGKRGQIEAQAQQIIGAAKAGVSQTEIAARFGCSIAGVHNLLKRHSALPSRDESERVRVAAVSSANRRRNRAA